MAFTLSLYISLAIFCLGLIYKMSTWFMRKIGISAENFSTSDRVSAAARGILGVVFSGKILTLIKVFVLDVVLQRRILKEDFLRWLMHMLIYAGFMLLLLMHALEVFISEPLFTDYYSTVNPFMFLRDLFGFMVIIGVGIAIYRRFILKVPRLKTNAMDHYAIIILAVIMISGVLLEAAKITSITEFEVMVEDYAGMTIEDDEEDIRALESYWVQGFGVVSPNVEAPFDEDVLAQGQEAHEASCMECHSAPQWAFTGYAVAKLSKPFALALDRAGASNILWYIHFLACFFGMAYLPFSKMFHIFSTPVSLLSNAVMDKEQSDPANIVTRQVMELDACMHCGTCSLRCSSSTAFDVLGNENILPSEKMVTLKTLAKGKGLSNKDLSIIQEGVYLCTNCDRCTVVCPAGINLRDLWMNVREDLIQRGYPEPLTLSPFSFFRGLNKANLPTNDYVKPLEEANKAVAGEFDQLMDKSTTISFKDREASELSRLPGHSTFSYCFGCQTCTTVCPVVACFEEPGESLGLFPHQIMNCLGLGLVEMASGPKMLWDCVTCYQCQEHCPQNVEVTDLLFQLKNIAVHYSRKAAEEIPADTESA
ncbi:MAG: 4Fe-4S dicluster domain-containing protein [Desulfobacterales bacterium]|nr:MAG: 4Fe-4S dicluster domain-containing protein [Desulfobacterales bacterium]